jgi:hypothetical protein
MSEAVANEQLQKCVWTSVGRGGGREFVTAVVAGVGLLSLLLAGCSQKSGVESVGAPVASLHLHGTAHGGEEPVSGATIQLYAVGTTGDGSASTPLLTQVVTSDANGEFTLTGDYQCPSASTLVYLMATGGNPGLPSGMTNPQLALMAALGSCGSLGSTTTINVNELTTVAAVWPLAPFMSSYSAIGSGSSDATALASAFATAATFANTTTGTVPGLNVPSGITVPVEQINTLADALASCVNSAGGVAGDGSACGILFAAATPSGGSAPVNVVGAGMNLANNPTLDSSNIFGLVGGKSPYQPTLTSAPTSLAVQLAQASSGLSYSASAFVFPATYLNFPATQTLTIANNSSMFVEITGLMIVGAEAAGFSETASPTQPCPGSPGLYPGQTCQIEIGFTPFVSGARSATLLLGSMVAELNGTVSSVSIPLSGAGLQHTGSSVTLSSSSLGFALAGVPQPVTATNNGMTPITLGPISTAGFVTETNNCGTLAPQSSCTIEVAVSEVESKQGLYSVPPTGSLTVTDSGTPGTQTIAVNEPFGPATFQATPINFGDTQLGVMSTSGQIEAIGTVYGGPGFGSVFVTGPNASDFLADVAGSDNTVSYLYVDFKPSALGPRTATLITSYGDIALSGNGVPNPHNANGPAFTMSPIAGEAMSPVGRSVPLSFQGSWQIINTGTTYLDLSFSITGPAAADFAMTGDLSSTQVLTSEGLQFGVAFTPSQIGVRTATLTATDILSGLANSIQLSGVGDPMAPAAAPNAITFPTTNAGETSAAQTITLSAPNGDPVSVLFSTGGFPISSPTSPSFLISPNTCGSQTPCQASVSFAPVRPGINTATLLVTDLVTNETATVALSGSGGVASLSLSSTALTFAAQNVGTTSVSQTVTLTNNGGPIITVGTYYTGGNSQDFPIEANTCGGSLASGASCAITISFDPTASGPRSAILEILSDAPNSPYVIQVSGIAN